MCHVIDMDEMTFEEATLLELQFRAALLYDFLGWDADYRRIGGVLLEFEPGTGTSARALERATYVPRRTIRRKLVVLAKNKLVQTSPSGLFSHTELGRKIHIMTFRDVVNIAFGRQSGLSPETEKALQDLAEHGNLDLSPLQNVKFQRIPGKVVRG